MTVRIRELDSERIKAYFFGRALTVPARSVDTGLAVFDHEVDV